MIRTRTETKTWNQILLAAVVLLLALSAFTYRESVQRADRFERGQKFLPHLDPDQIAEIVLRRGTAAGELDGTGPATEEVVLRRAADGERFVVVSEGGYLADNAEVNRLLRSLLDLELEKEIGESAPKLAERLGVATLDDGALDEGTVEVALRNAADQDIVRFLVGSSSSDGPQGRYLRRMGKADDGAESGGTIYLTQGRAELWTGGGAFLDKEILDLPRTDVVAIRGVDFAMVRGEDGELRVEGLAEGEKESTRASSVKGLLSPLRFTSHHLADAAAVRDLEFDRSVQVELADGSGYVVELARSPQADAYVRVRGFHSTEQVSIARDASEDEVRATSELLVRADEIADFNEIHGSWIYGVSSTVADRVAPVRVDLVDDLGA